MAKKAARGPAPLRAALLFLGVAASTALSAFQVSDAQLVLQRGTTRIVLDSDAAFRFSLFSLTNPERVVLDLEGVQLGAVLAALAGKPGADHPHLRSLRVRQHTPDVVRLELDLRVEAEAQILAEKPKGPHAYRLVLEVHPAQSETSPAEAPQPASASTAAAVGADTAAGKATAADTVAGKATAAAGNAGAAGASGNEETWLAVRINGQDPAETALLLRRQDGRLLANGSDLQRWRLRVPADAAVPHGGELYYPLDALRGLSYRMDTASQALDLDAAPGLFGATLLHGTQASFAVPAPAPPGGFLNYDFFLDRSRGGTAASGAFELGAFNALGVGVANFAARDTPEGRRLVRLATTWTSDRPAQLATLRLGDAVSASGQWGRSVRFGGVQWATNFGTQPGFITFPLPGLAGEAVLPSTIDLYVNDALRLRREVPMGPFSVQDLPVVTGQGEARLVVRDLLGRERTIVQPFYSSPRLLQQGLHDYSYEVGRVRENFGLASNDYGRFMAVATHRLGFSDRFTGELRGELRPGQQTVGLGSSWLMPRAGLFGATVAGSHGERGAGGLLSLGFERQGRSLSFGGNMQLASERFAQIGLQPGERAPRQTTQAYMSVGMDRYGSVGLSYAYQGNRDREVVKLASANYSLTLGNLGFVSLSLMRVLGGEPNTAIALTFTRPLDERTSASVQATRDGGNAPLLAQVQRNLPTGDGFGYRVRAAGGDTPRLEASASLQNPVGTYSVEAAQSRGQTGIRAAASGGVAMLGGGAFAGRRIDDAFGVVQVPGYPGVRVYADNQEVARTGADGSALVPRLRPYQKNALRIEQADLPLDAQVDEVQMAAVPYFRSGAVMRFPVKRSQGALLRVVLENGEPLPAGAVARLVGEKEEFPAGLGGEVYVTGLAAQNRLRVTWRGGQCEFAVPFPQTADPLPRLGPFTCNGVRP
jgi:outer membrane usher protein